MREIVGRLIPNDSPTLLLNFVANSSVTRVLSSIDRFVNFRFFDILSAQSIVERFKTLTSTKKYEMT